MGNKLVVIVGPTAVGKTKIGIEVASRINGEIVSGDSMQVYQGMDIGTDKISPEDTIAENRIMVNHYMIDIVSPEENYSVAFFQKDARNCIEFINKQKKIPILLGGTGLYVKAVIDKYNFEIIGDRQLRDNIKNLAGKIGKEKLHHELKKVDPVSALKLHPNDLHRVSRALEYYCLTGEPLSNKQYAKSKDSIYNPLIMIGLWLPRTLLYERINERVDKMISQGLVAEVEGLLQKGVKPNNTSMQALGYRQIAAHLTGEYSLKKAIELIKRDTRRFAKRQLTWFKTDERIKWIDIFNKTRNGIIKEIETEIGRNINI